MPSALAVKNDSPNELRRYEALLDMADLMVRHRIGVGMLRITIDEKSDSVVLRLEGKLIGPWVEEVEQCWRNAFATHPLHRLMQLHWWEGEPAADFPVQVPVSESASGWVWGHQEELSFPRLRGETRFPRVLDALRAKGTETYYVVPLTTAEKRLGALGFASAKPDAYGEQDRRLLRRVAELAAVAVENTLTHEALHAEQQQRWQALVDVNRTMGVQPGDAASFAFDLRTRDPCRAARLRRCAPVRRRQRQHEGLRSHWQDRTEHRRKCPRSFECAHESG